MCRGDPRQFDAVVASSGIQKLPGRWLRLLLLLGGDIERNPGPDKLLGRGKLDMTVGFRAETAVRMSKCLQAFSTWVATGAQLPWDRVCSDPEALSWALRAYGMHCFEIGLPRYLYTYAITACQDRFASGKFTNLANADPSYLLLQSEPVLVWPACGSGFLGWAACF